MLVANGDTYNGSYYFLLGVFHAADIPYIMGLAHMPNNEDVRSDAGFTTIDFVGFNEEDWEYSDFIMDTWTNYVKFG